MGDVDNSQDSSEEIEQFPVEPRYHPANRLIRSVYDILASSRLAMALLVAILVSCICGGVFFQSEQAHQFIYGTLWFNALLVLLVINTACCFFGRIWGRRVTIVSFGMILFHLSFVVMFLAIVFNSLFYFDGLLRLTEGETVKNGDRQIYDNPRHGLFFDYSQMKGTTTLLKFQRGFKLDGDEKNFAYDLVFENGKDRLQDQIYINHKVENNSVEYFRDREGYSLLVILEKAAGGELYGAHFPLQSLRQLDGSYTFTTGTSEKADRLNFPPEKGAALFGLQVEYKIDPIKDRDGTVHFQIWPKIASLSAGSVPHNGQTPPDGSVPHNGQPPSDGSAPHNGQLPSDGSAPHGMTGDGVFSTSGGHDASMVPTTDLKSQERLAAGAARIGEKFIFGDYALKVPEVRYWVGMNVRYSPGKPVVLTALWVGLSGLIVTMYGRFRRTKSYSRVDHDKSVAPE